MTASTCTALAAIRRVMGKQYTSRWFPVTQEQMDAFSAATGDNQWIHRGDVEPGQGPFGGPIAHGLLLASLAINLARDAGALPEATWVLYGFDKLRFRAPVHGDICIRCLTLIRDFQELGGRLLLNVRFVIETADGKIPALTTNCSLLYLDRQGEV